MKTEYKPCEFTFTYKGVDGESLTKHFRTTDGATWHEPLAGFKMFLQGIGYQFDIGSEFDLVPIDDTCSFDDCDSCGETCPNQGELEETTPPVNLGYWHSKFVEDMLNHKTQGGI